MCVLVGSLGLTGVSGVAAQELPGSRDVVLPYPDAGKIVGVAQTVDGINHAVVWDASTGSILDLNSVIPSDTNWVLNEARDYNAAGVIVGDGTLNGAARAFALVPSD